MTYIDIIKDFWKEHEGKPFTPLATLLYFRLLEECNRKKWKNPFPLPSVNLEESVNPSRKMLGKAREELRERGLLEYVAGHNRPTLFFIKKLAVNNAEIWPLSEHEKRVELFLKCFLNVSQMFLKCFQNVSQRNNDTYYFNIYKDNKDVEEDKEESPSSSTVEKDAGKKDLKRDEIPPENPPQNSVEKTSPKSENRVKIFDEVAELKNSRIWIEQTCINHHKTPEEIIALLDGFATSCYSDGITGHRDDRDLKSHFNAWVRTTNNNRNETRDRAGTRGGATGMQSKLPPEPKRGLIERDGY